ncbi:hypothetical protein ODJ79_39700 [Actinoplanes sp. KI2]|uniref:hypothetical protein n=1 Tax=Actinoplanes sp. KI2 TaxID=2983315 RepID=UPI0021D59B61|nr:hypothetical protein [Actinoplanes sp. KI2]MCU7729878.1 hypothetical protein [Actinoplanes sp. KI2]
MTQPLGRLLEQALDGEPAPRDEIDEVFRRADKLRRRRLQAAVGAGVAVIAVIAAAGYALTTTLLPPGQQRDAGRHDPVQAGAPVRPVAAPQATRTAAPPPSIAADPVLRLLAPIVEGRQERIRPRPPERGNGWRQYSVTDRDGTPRGTVTVAVYATGRDFCFPVRAGSHRCARVAWAPGGVEYVRYDDGNDRDWQARQTTARRTSDGRTIALMATGEHGGDTAAAGKPGLTGAQVERLATDRRLFDAFGRGEDCFGPSSGACPAFKVPLPSPKDEEDGTGSR